LQLELDFEVVSFFAAVEKLNILNSVGSYGFAAIAAADSYASAIGRGGISSYCDSAVRKRAMHTQRGVCGRVGAGSE
jgi:hypothetical protein